MKIPFLLLCSGDEKRSIELLNNGYFNDENIKVYVHYDGKAPLANFSRLKSFAESINVAFSHRRIRCHWGQYDLVEATCLLIDLVLRDDEFSADYLYLISESCFPVRSFNELREHLASNHLDYIETRDPCIKGWAVGGHEMSRLTRYYPFNFRSQRRLFDLTCKLQDAIGIRRAAPRMPIRFGSQWFCLRRETATIVLDRLNDDSLVRHLRSTWIPDEFVIQSLVAQSVPFSKICPHSLTYVQFDDLGVPIEFYDDHMEYLSRQPHFFARKRSPFASKLLQMHTKSHKEQCVKSTRKNRSLVPTADFHIFQNQVEHRVARVGGIKDQWWHPMDLNKRRYFVVSGVSRIYINHVLRILASWKDYDVHGYIFDRDSISTFNDLEARWYDEDDIHIRNYNPLGFLYDIVNGSEKECVFALDWGDLHGVVSRVIYDDNCSVILLDPPVRTKLEKLVLRLTPELASAIATLPADERAQAIYKQFEADDIGFWDRSDSGAYKCHLISAPYRVGGVTDGILSACENVKFGSVFSRHHLELLKMINPSLNVEEWT